MILGITSNEIHDNLLQRILNMYKYVYAQLYSSTLCVCGYNAIYTRA